MRSIEMKNRCLLYYGNPVGYRTEQGVVADSMFRREELEDWLAKKGLAVQWTDGVYDRLSTGGYQAAADSGPALKACRIWQLGPSAPTAMRFIGLNRMSKEYDGPDLSHYQVVFDGTVSTNSLDGIWEAFCRKPLGSDGPAAGHLRSHRALRRFQQRVLLCGPHIHCPGAVGSTGAGIGYDHDPVTPSGDAAHFSYSEKGGVHHAVKRTEGS